MSSICADELVSVTDATSGDIGCVFGLVGGLFFVSRNKTRSHGTNRAPIISFSMGTGGLATLPLVAVAYGFNRRSKDCVHIGILSASYSFSMGQLIPGSGWYKALTSRPRHSLAGQPRASASLYGMWFPCQGVGAAAATSLGLASGAGAQPVKKGPKGGAGAEKRHGVEVHVPSLRVCLADVVCRVLIFLCGSIWMTRHLSPRTLKAGPLY